MIASNIKRKPPPIKQHYHQGNALFLILIAVALFAGLSYAVTQSSRNGGNISRETTILATSEASQYATVVEQAVNRAQIIGGCTDQQLSFDNDIADFYDNPSAPQDCKVFRLGDLIWTDPPSSIWPKSGVAFHRVSYGFTGQISIPGVATDETELLMVFQVKTIDICRLINKEFNGIADAPTGQAFCFSPFVGDYTPSGACPDPVWEDLSGRLTGCVKHSSADDYFFYHVLKAR